MDWLDAPFENDYDDFGMYLNEGFDEGLVVETNEAAPAVGTATGEARSRSGSGSNRHSYNRKSAAAEKREEEARDAFMQICGATEATEVETTVLLLSPR